MELLKYFFECCFNESEKFKNLDKIIKEFKNCEHEKTQLQLIQELHQIIQTKNYAVASNIIDKHGGRIINIEKTEQMITYIYNKLLDLPAILNEKDFYKDCKVVFCPVCTPDPEKALVFNLIEKANVIKNNLQVYICKPCKLVWLTEDIHSNNAQDYKKIMKTLGLKGLWRELKDINIL